MIDPALTTIRFALYADLSLLLGIPLFLRTVAGPIYVLPRRTLAVLAILALALSALWLIASAAVMAGTPFTAPDMAVIAILLGETPIGPVLAVRAAALAALAAWLALRGGSSIVIALAALAAATSAWTGHAGATEDTAGTLHRLADMLHLWAAAGWIGALAVLLARLVRRDDPAETGRMLHDFAPWGTLYIAVLAISGVINGGMIAGWLGLLLLTGSLYGMLLIAKLGLFAAMLALAAANRWWLTPKAQSSPSSSRAKSTLQISIAFETITGFLILFLVAILGSLEPVSEP